MANSETSNSSITRAMEESQRMFHNVFATKKNFKREIESTIKCKGITENLKSTLTPASLAFVAFVSQNCESFLLTSQRKEPIIHIFYILVLQVYVKSRFKEALAMHTHYSSIRRSRCRGHVPKPLQCL